MQYKTTDDDKTRPLKLKLNMLMHISRMAKSFTSVANLRAKKNGAICIARTAGRVAIWVLATEKCQTLFKKGKREKFWFFLYETSVALKIGRYIRATTSYTHTVYSSV